MTDQVRIGFIGAGLIANRHLGDLLGFHDVRVVAVADLEPERAAGLAERCGGTAYAEFEEMLDREHLDGVYICVPPFAHGQPEAAVLDRGLPFFVEKPLGADLATAETIAARVAAESIVTATGYHWRYLDITERAQALLAEKLPHLALGFWLDFTPPPEWWAIHAKSVPNGRADDPRVRSRPIVGGRGDPRPCRGGAHRAPQFPQADVDVVSIATLHFASGALGTIASTCLLRTGPIASGSTSSARGWRSRCRVRADGRRRPWSPDPEGRGRPVRP